MQFITRLFPNIRKNLLVATGLSGTTAIYLTLNQTYCAAAICEVAPNGKPCASTNSSINVVNGTVTFNQEKESTPTTITYRITGLTPGKHGFHV